MKSCEYLSPIGKITLAAHEAALVGLWFEGQKYERAGLFDAPESAGDEAVLCAAQKWLDSYFAGKKPEIVISLAPRGTEFQKRVWNTLTEIPYGKTVSYGELAAKLGCRSARSVGTAVGRNPVSVIIPCHRVVGSDGSLTGYAGGLDKKRFLLSIELDKDNLDV